MRKPLDTAYRSCIRIAKSHYENFPVLSWTLPSRLRPHVAAVYAFAREADDDADERMSPQRLDEKRRRIETGAFDGDPVFEALGDTIRRFDLPAQPFLDLLSAFRQDTEKRRYETYEEVLDYCRRSADPVGRIVLMLFGYRDSSRFALSDRICTALQLINFWQDVATDYTQRNRIYIPSADLAAFGVQEADLTDGGHPRLRELLRELVRRTEQMMKEGRPLVQTISFRLRLPVALFAAGGDTILQRLKSGGPRPTLNDWNSRIRMPANFFRICFAA